MTEVTEVAVVPVVMIEVERESPGSSGRPALGARPGGEPPGGRGDCRSGDTTSSFSPSSTPPSVLCSSRGVDGVDDIFSPTRNRPLLFRESVLICQCTSSR